MTDVRLPRLLNADMTENTRLHPTGLRIELNLTPLSTATMTLPPEESVAMHDWVQLFTPNGSAGIYRVSGIRKTYTGTTTVELEHGLAALGDGLLAGEGTLEGSAQTVLTHMLAYQVAKANGANLFTAGTAAGGTVSFEYDYHNILSALLTVVEDLGDYRLTCDQTSLPWKVGIEALPTAPTCEGRLSRNLTGVDISFDDADLCTRMYCAELDNDTHYINGSTMAKYGIICKTVTATTNVDQSSLVSYMTRYLAEHAEPTVAIELDAVDLSAATGEALDAFTVGKLCRIALPDYGVVMNERILSVAYNDAYGTPGEVRVSLSSRLRDTAKNLATIAEETTSSTSKSRAGSGGGSSGSGIGLGGTSLLDMLKMQEIVADEQGATLYQAGLDITAQGVRLSASEQHIDTLTDRVSTAEASITVNANNIELKVSKDGVISSINQTAESVRISASKINLDGYVTASQLSSELASFQLSMSNNMTTNNLAVNSRAYLPSYCTMNSQQFSWQSKDVVTGVSLSKEGVTVPGSNGVSYYVMSSVSLSRSTDTIYYLGSG